MNLSKSVSLTGRAVSATLHSICIGKVSTVWEKVSDNFKNYFFASAFVLLWEFVTDDEGKLVRIWHFCLCYAYLSNYVIFVMFSACEMFICQIMLSLWVFFLLVWCLLVRCAWEQGRFTLSVCLRCITGGTHQWLKKVHKDVKAHIREDFLHFKFFIVYP